MKKNELINGKLMPFRRWKIVLIMKLQLVFILGILLQSFANVSVAQSQKINLELKNNTLKEVFQIIEDQSEYSFIYKDELLSPDRKYSGNFKSKSATEVLDEVLEGENLSYMVKGRVIVILADEEAKKNAQQGGSVSGKVTDSDGQAIPGATVFIKGTAKGAITDMDGNYSLEVPAGSEVIVFSFIGMKTEEINIAGRSKIDIVLSLDVIGIEEVVAVGYGTMKRSDITGSVGSMGTEKIIESRNTRPIGALQGKVAGVDIIRTSNKPGGGFKVNVRGINTFRSNSNPLYVVDGITVDHIDDINPEDIEKIDVLKDASSAAIYGSRGANGVVIVTTKNGKEGQSKIEYNGYVGLTEAYNLPEIMNTEEFVEFALASQVGKGNTNPSLADVFNPEEIENINKGVSINWPDLMLRTAMVTNHSLSVSGGNNGHIYSYGGSVTSEEGVVGNEKYERMTLRSSNEKQFNDFLKIGLRNNMSYSVRDEGSKEAFRSAYRLRPIGTLYDEDGEYKLWPSPRETQISSPMIDMNEVTREDRVIHYFANMFIEIKPTSWMTFTSTFSPDIKYTRYGEYRGLNTKSAKGQPKNRRAYYKTWNYWRYTWDNIINVEKSFDGHNLKGTFVSSIYKHREDHSEAQVRNFPTDDFLFFNLGAGSDIRTLKSSYNQESLASFLGRISYDYQGKYYATVNGRYDGSSRLAPGNKWAFFPSAAVAWRVSEEAFMQDNNTFTNLKVRLSYGKTGSAAVDRYQSQVSMSNIFYDFDNNGVSAVNIGGIANYGLTWEETEELNLGIDFGILGNRISGSLELYDRESNMLLRQRNLPLVTGHNSIWDNIGSLKNQGFELSVNTVNIKRGDFEWNTNITFSTNKNEILEIYGSGENDEGNQWFIGEDITTHWEYQTDGIWQLDEASEAAKYSQDPGEVKVVDQNNDGKIDTDDRVFIGKETPDWYGSMINTIKYKNFDLSVFINTRQGQMVKSEFHNKFAWDQDGRFNGLKTNYWTPDNPTGTWHQPGNAGPYRGLENFMETSYWKVGYINLGYNFSDRLAERLHLEKLRLYVSAQNPFVFTDYEGWDPENASENTWGYAFMTRSILFGINVQF